MTAPAWQPLTVYSPGAQVTRATVPSVEVAAPVNQNFELGDVNWTKEANWTITNSGSGMFNGSWGAKLSNTGGGSVYRRIYSAATVPAAPGQILTVSCMVRQGGADADKAGAKVQVEFLDASNVSLLIVDGNLVKRGSSGEWKRSQVTATAPPNTAKLRIGASGFQNTSNHLWVDAFLWDYSFRPEYTSFVYTAVQAGDGVSAATEPTWPSDPTTTVSDGTVTWQAIYGSSVKWEAVPLLESGATEPVWPLEVGSTITDGSIVWTAASRRVKDVKCPNTKVVAIAASKIFAADKDIIAYSATVDPLDWTTVDDAGYLPFGLQTHGANPVSAMGLYRGNLVAFNSAGFQMWQVDQDPQNMALLDAAPIGCTEPRAVKPLQNDLIFINPVGVRNISIAGASTNLQAGSSGEPIDALVKPELDAGTYDPISAFWPAYGQYWAIFGPQVFVLSLNEGKNGKWSRYVFPEALTDVTLLDNDLYVRTATHKVWRVSDEFLVDDKFDPAVTSVSQPGTSDLSTFTGFDVPVAIGGAPYFTWEKSAGSPTGAVLTDMHVWQFDQAITGKTVIAAYLSQAGVAAAADAFYSLQFTDVDGVVRKLIRTEASDPNGYVTATGDSFGHTIGGSRCWYWEFDTDIPILSAGDTSYPVTVDTLTGVGDPLASAIPFSGVIHWPHLDFGSLGVEKQFIGFDIVADAPGGVSVSIGYDQRNIAARTADYAIDGDSLPGKLIPIPVTAPSFDMKLTFAPNQRWEWLASVIYINDLRAGS